ncbi:MAG: endonuclease III domain-containing protein [Caldimicrobium sp.]
MKNKLLEDVFKTLFGHFGAQNWWPAETPFEVCVGAILTQNTNWKNVEKAIDNLKKNNLLTPEALYSISQEYLAELIRPCGFYQLKAKRLKNFVEFLIKEYNGDIKKLKTEDLESLREKLLQIKGLGKETVDSILLYALDKPIFVVDAYTHRILNRHSLISEEISYDELQEFFLSNLPRDVNLYKEYHALFVVCGKNYCKKSQPLCELCPLKIYSP